MRIAKSVLIKPGENELYAIPAVALSLFCFAYSIRFGQVAILFYYALWLPLVAVNYRKVLGSYSRFIWLFAFAVFAFLSVFWSAVPSVSLRASIQYLTQVICALIAVRVLDVRTLTLGVVAGAAVVLLFSILFGYYEYDVLDGTYSFVGAFASKNQLGFLCVPGHHLRLCRRLHLRRAPFLDDDVGHGWPYGGLSPACLAIRHLGHHDGGDRCPVDRVSRRAHAVAATTQAAGGRRRRRGCHPGGGGGGVYLGAVDAVLGIFGKDSTLTGRTYLWQQGIEAAAQNPAIGIGYQAYWVQGFAEPERLWKEFFIASRAGFHFHNTYIETAVELGLIGVLILAVTFIATLWGHLRRLIEDVRNDESYFLFGITVLLLIRSFVEIDVLTPYNVGSFLLYFFRRQACRRAPALGDGRPAPLPIC